MEIQRADPYQRGLATAISTEHHPPLARFDGPIDTTQDRPAVAHQTDIFKYERRCAGNRFDGRDGQGLLVDQEGESNRREGEHDTRNHCESIEVLLNDR